MHLNRILERDFMATLISEDRLSKINDSIRGLIPDSVEVAQLRKDLTSLNNRVNSLVGFVGSTGRTVEGEVAEIRNMIGGETAANAGDAVRKQVGELIVPKGYETRNTRMNYAVDGTYTIIPTMDDLIDLSTIEELRNQISDLEEKTSYMESLFLSRMEVPIEWTIGALDDTGVETDSLTHVRSGYIHLADFTKIHIGDGYKYRVFLYSDTFGFLTSSSFMVEDKTAEDLKNLAEDYQKPTYIRIQAKKNTANPENLTHTSEITDRLEITPVIVDSLSLQREIGVLKTRVEALLNLSETPGEGTLAAMVEDIKVSGLEEGYVYSSPGTAVRSQVRKTWDHVDDGLRNVESHLNEANRRMDVIEERPGFQADFWKAGVSSGILLAPATKFKITKDMTQKEAYAIMARAGVAPGMYSEPDSAWGYPNNALYSGGGSGTSFWFGTKFACYDYDMSSRDLFFPYVLGTKVVVGTADDAPYYIKPKASEAADTYYGEIIPFDYDKWIVQKIKATVSGSTVTASHEGFYLLTKANLESWLDSAVTVSSTGNVTMPALSMAKIASMSTVKVTVTPSRDSAIAIGIHVAEDGGNMIAACTDGKIYNFTWSAAQGTIIKNGEIKIDGTALSSLSGTYDFFRDGFPTAYCHNGVFTVVKRTSGSPSELLFLATSNYKDFTTSETLSLTSWRNKEGSNCTTIYDAVSYNGKIYAVSGNKDTSDHKYEYVHFMIYDKGTGLWSYVENDAWKVPLNGYAVNNTEFKFAFTNMCRVGDKIFYSLGGHLLFSYDTVTNSNSNITSVVTSQKLVYRDSPNLNTSSQLMVTYNKIPMPMFTLVSAISYDQSMNMLVLHVEMDNLFFGLGLGARLLVGLDPDTLESYNTGVQGLTIGSGFSNAAPVYPAYRQGVFDASGSSAVCNDYGTLLLKKEDIQVAGYKVRNWSSQEAVAAFAGGEPFDSLKAGIAGGQIKVKNDVLVKMLQAMTTNLEGDGIAPSTSEAMNSLYSDWKSHICIDFGEENLDVKTSAPVYNATSIMVTNDNDCYEIALTGASSLWATGTSGCGIPYAPSYDMLSIGRSKYLPFLRIDKYSDEPVGATFYWNFPAQFGIADPVKGISGVMALPYWKNIG